MEGSKTCPICLEVIDVEALICRFCDHDLRTGKPVVRPPALAEPIEEKAVPVQTLSIGRRLLGLVGRLAAAAIAILIGVFVLLLWLAGSGQDVPSGCVRHVELHAASVWARDLERPESWVVRNHRINLWSRSSSSGDKGRVVGAMRPGSRAVVIEDDGADYLVKSPLDGAIGWVARVQVARELWQDTRTRERCR